MSTEPGDPALTLAGLVGPAGHVTGVDLAEKMVTAARRAAESRDVPNVTFREMGGSELDFLGQSFDAVACAFGFRIFTNPENRRERLSASSKAEAA